jgi:hypothetical protein
MTVLSQVDDKDQGSLDEPDLRCDHFGGLLAWWAKKSQPLTSVQGIGW